MMLDIIQIQKWCSDSKAKAFEVAVPEAVLNFWILALVCYAYMAFWFVYLNKHVTSFYNVNKFSLSFKVCYNRYFLSLLPSSFLSSTLCTNRSILGSIYAPPPRIIRALKPLVAEFGKHQKCHWAKCPWLEEISTPYIHPES